MMNNALLHHGLNGPNGSSIDPLDVDLIFDTNDSALNRLDIVCSEEDQVVSKSMPDARNSDGSQ